MFSFLMICPHDKHHQHIALRDNNNYFTLLSLSQIRLATSTLLIPTGTIFVTSFKQTVVFMHVKVTSFCGPHAKNFADLLFT